MKITGQYTRKKVLAPSDLITVQYAWSRIHPGYDAFPVYVPLSVGFPNYVLAANKAKAVRLLHFGDVFRDYLLDVTSHSVGLGHDCAH